MDQVMGRMDLGNREAMHGFGQAHQVKQCGSKVKAKTCLLTAVSTARFYCDF